MQVDNLRENYRKLNDSFDKSLAYGIGMHGGFFSEINLMVVTMVYCLHHKIRFVPHSGAATFQRHKGWIDYFELFYPEVEDERLNTLDTRVKRSYKFNPTKPRRLLRSLNYQADLVSLKQRHRLNYLTYDLWNKIYDRVLEHLHYDIPELGISGDFQHACHVISSLIWHFNEDTNTELRLALQKLQLPESYVGFQIRRGDKHIEADLLAANKYIRAAEENTLVRSAFILTDDFTTIKELEGNHPNWTFYTLCKPEERGYIHTEFISRTREQVYEGTLKLIVSVEILRRSDLFIGTFSANPGWFLGMIMERDCTISMDVPFQIFGGKEVETTETISR